METSQFTFKQKAGKFTPSTRKVMLTVFWDSQGVLLAHFQKRGENVNSASYCKVLLKIRDSICSKLPGQLARGVLLHHENAIPHTARATQERIQELQWELREHPPYGRDLAPSDFHLFEPLKNSLGDKRFADDEVVETEVRTVKRLLCCGFRPSGKAMEQVY
jgi:histone-lysine N-methyltransferase SETMAR